VCSAVVLLSAWLASVASGDSVHLVLNIPAMRLDVYSGLSVERSYRTAVGTSAFPTPIGNYRIRKVIWAPWWIPPPSDWAKNERITPPGASNPLGLVKLPFTGLYAIHGTNDSLNIGSSVSHGCVRMRNADAEALARTLVAAGTRNGAGYTSRPGETTVTLETPIALRVTYDLVEVRDTMLLIHHDVYRRRSKPYRVLIAMRLLAAGVDTAGIDMRSLERVASAGLSGTLSFPLSHLRRKPKASVVVSRSP